MKTKKSLVSSIIEQTDIRSPEMFAKVMHCLNKTLLSACAKGKIEVVLEFHDANWDLDRQINGTTPLIEAIKHNKRGRNDAIITFILEKYGSYAANATDDKNKTPLFYTVREDGGIQKKTVLNLARMGIDIHARDKNGDTVFQARQMTPYSANTIKNAWSKVRTLSYTPR